MFSQLCNSSNIELFCAHKISCCPKCYFTCTVGSHNERKFAISIICRIVITALLSKIFRLKFSITT